MDNLSKERRSWNMGRIRSGNTAPEMNVRSALHRMGLRFRLHVKGLPGKPDIVLPKWQHVIFVHGCFWHRHTGCKFAYTPKTRIDFWTEKFRQNLKRDETATRELRRMGWNVSIIWECETSTPALLSKTLTSLAARIRCTRQTRRGAC
jgi:DNA mismatch endonuclease (patch repair protein)